MASSAPKAALFDIDGTLIDSVDLHARAWVDALTHFGHEVTFEHVRSQIGKGGDQLLPVYLSETEQDLHGKEMETYRGERFRAEYLPMIRPFSSVPDLLRLVRDAGCKVAVASSAKQQELQVYLEIAGIADLVDATTSSDDVAQSKPAPDVFQAALKKLGTAAAEALAIGDSPYDMIAARRIGMPAIGFLSGGFTEADLREAGAVAIYPGPGALWACFGSSLLGAG